MKSPKVIIIALLVLAVVVAGVGAFALRNDPKTSNNETATNQTDIQQPQTAETKSATEKEFEQYTGEDYDRIFIANMLEHHRGAIEMADLALTNAKHQELKDMAQEIITTQTDEREKMLGWQKAWGFPASSGEDMMDHSAMGMGTYMDRMTEELRGKTGDEFDKLFLSLMIEHHQGAVDMSRPAANNASHQEIKDLAAAIIEDQDAEIAQMRAWLNEWGYES